MRTPEQGRRYARTSYHRHRDAINARKRAARTDGSYRLKKYGISAEAYAEALRRQNGLCAICEGPFPKWPRIDHDHESGAFRGLLCHRCNIGLGLFQDNMRALESAMDYIRCGPMA